MRKLVIKPRNIVKLILLGVILISFGSGYCYYSSSMWGENSVVEASTQTMKSDAHVIIQTDNTQSVVTADQAQATMAAGVTAIKPTVIVATTALPQTGANHEQALMITLAGAIGIASAIELLNLRRNGTIS